MIAVNDSFWLNSLAYILLIAKFQDHACYTDLIDLFHLVSIVNTLQSVLRNFILNKNTLGVKKVRGQSEATCKQAGATKSFDIS